MPGLLILADFMQHEGRDVAAGRMGAPASHRALDELEAMHVSFDLSVAPGLREGCMDSGFVTPKMSGEVNQRPGLGCVPPTRPTRQPDAASPCVRTWHRVQTPLIPADCAKRITIQIPRRLQDDFLRIGNRILCPISTVGDRQSLSLSLTLFRARQEVSPNVRMTHNVALSGSMSAFESLGLFARSCWHFNIPLDSDRFNEYCCCR
jgi:hypothetical protein